MLPITLRIVHLCCGFHAQNDSPLRGRRSMLRVFTSRSVPMSVFEAPDFDHHEAVAFFDDKASGLRAIIAIHSTALGPACGGTRMFKYATTEDALTDALRLSRGMSYKSA